MGDCTFSNPCRRYELQDLAELKGERTFWSSRTGVRFRPTVISTSRLSFWLMNALSVMKPGK